MDKSIPFPNVKRYGGAEALSPAELVAKGIPANSSAPKKKKRDAAWESLDFDAICEMSAASVADFDFPMNNKPASWKEVLLAMHPGDDRSEFECPSSSCGFSAKSEWIVVDHCLGESDSKLRCPEEKLFVKLYWKHEEDIQERVSAVLAANPDRVKEANDLEVTMVSELTPLKDAFPDQYAKFKGYAKQASAYLVSQCADPEIGRSREISQHLEEVCLFSFELKMRQLGM